MFFKLNSCITALQSNLEQKDWGKWSLLEIICSFKLTCSYQFVFMEIDESDGLFDLIDMV